LTQLDISQWSGEGAFTQILVDRLQQLEEIVMVRVQDAPATRSEANYNFVSNEIFVAFGTKSSERRVRLFGVLPATRRVAVPAMTVSGLEEALTANPDVGAPDYSDEGMLQYLRTERIVPPYQTRGYKLVELVRLYEARPGSSRRNEAGRQANHRSTNGGSSS
jgi:hypothetical protein